MKVYISADIEGVAGITHWDEATKTEPEYQEYREQMTREVVAACDGAFAAGATEIIVKDAHWTARNLITSELPRGVKLIRGWSGHPFSMVQELDDSFHALIMVGYHAAAGSDSNPLAHTITLGVSTIKINGVLASEFLLNAYAAALVDVPVVFVSGDEGLCQEVTALNDEIETVAVSRGIGDSTISIAPQLAIERIRVEVTAALERDVSACKIQLPKQFHAEIRFRDHQKALRASFYPGVIQIDPHTVAYETNDYFELLRMKSFTI